MPSSLFVFVAIAKELSSVISLIVIPDREFFKIISQDGFFGGLSEIKLSLSKYIIKVSPDCGLP